MSELLEHYVDLHTVGTTTQLRGLLGQGYLHQLDFVAATEGVEGVVNWLVTRWQATDPLTKGYLLMTRTPFFILDEAAWEAIADKGWALREEPGQYRLSNQARLLFEVIKTNE